MHSSSQRQIHNIISQKVVHLQKQPHFCLFLLPNIISEQRVLEQINEKEMQKKKNTSADGSSNQFIYANLQYLYMQIKYVHCINYFSHLIN